jgi:hypothetical protein
LAKTKDEKKHYDRLSQLGCVVCLREGHGYTQPAIHHIRSDAGMGMKSHWSKAIPLCPMHHQHGGWGVALHAGQKEFEKRYGTEEELLEYTTQCLNTV